VLSLRSSLLGGAAVPFDGFSVVLRDAQTVGAHDPQLELSLGKPLLGKWPKVLYRRGIISSFVGFVSSVKGLAEGGSCREGQRRDE
jgi:hypothetical protein